MKTKCPNCGGKIAYNPATQELHCDHCGSMIIIKAALQNNEKHIYSQKSALKEQKTNVYHCNSCNSNLVISGDSSVSRCPNCGSKDLSPQNKSFFTPDAILPFSITKEKAVEIFQQFISKGAFLPNDLSKMAQLGKLSGTYIPVYVYDTKTSTTYSGTGVDHKEDSDGNSYNSYTHFSGTLQNDYRNVFISGNNSFETATIQKLVPWDLGALRVYDDAYLFGFIASDVNIGLHQSYLNFKSRINELELQDIKHKHRHDEYRDMRILTSFIEPKYNYISLPVYANYYTYKDQKYKIYINGSTGKIIGRKPRSWRKILGLVFGILGGIAAVVGLALGLTLGLTI